VGNGTLNASKAAISFTSNSENNYNTRNDAIVRTRSGGSVVPPKFTQKYVLAREIYLANRYVVNKPWSVSNAVFDSEVCEIESSRYGRYVTLLTKRKIWRSADYGITWSTVCTPNDIVERLDASVFSFDISIANPDYRDAIITTIVRSAGNGGFVYYLGLNDPGQILKATLVNALTSAITFDTIENKIKNIRVVLVNVKAADIVGQDAAISTILTTTMAQILSNDVTLADILKGNNTIPASNISVRNIANDPNQQVILNGKIVYDFNTYNNQFVSLLSISPNGKYQVAIFATNNINILFSIDYGLTWNTHTTSDRNPATGIGVTNNGSVFFSNSYYSNRYYLDPRESVINLATSTIYYDGIFITPSPIKLTNNTEAFSNIQTILNFASSDNGLYITLANFYSGAIYVSKDGGISFTKVTIYYNGNIQNSFPTPNEYIVRDANKNPNDPSSIIDSYFPLPTSGLGFQGSINMSSDGKLQFITDKTRNMYRSIDYGVTWNKIYPVLESGVSILGANFQKRSISPDGKLHLISAGTNIDPTILYFSSDYGVTWQRLNNTYTSNINTGYTPIITSKTYLNYNSIPQNNVYKLYYYNNPYPQETPEDLV
jgi:hypothetical protein